MNLEELFEQLDITSGSEFEYFENFADFVEHDGAVDSDTVYELLTEVDMKTFAAVSYTHLIGMGAGSKKGKMEMHSSGTPRILKKNCIGCGMCVKNCANDGVHVIDKLAVIDEEKCLGCGFCIAYCPKGAIATKWDEAKPVMNRKIAEYTKAVLAGKPSFHISLLVDVSPDCDCEGGNDIPVSYTHLDVYKRQDSI